MSRPIKFRAWNGDRMLPVAEIRQDYEEVVAPGEGSSYLPTTLTVELVNGDFLSFEPSQSADERLMQHRPQGQERCRDL